MKRLMLMLTLLTVPTLALATTGEIEKFYRFEPSGAETPAEGASR